MKKLKTIALSLLLLPAVAAADATPGKAAPKFEVKDAMGQVHKLEDYAGKWLVLEWYNEGCPYVKKHYGSGNMQKLQETYTAKEVKWLTVISSAKGKQGHLDEKQAKEFAQKASASAVLIDSSGAMGKAYGAKTTPHMFVISPKGEVVYAGAIDDNDSSNPKVIEKSKNYVVAALDAAMAGKPVAETSTQPYGCSVKY